MRHVFKATRMGWDMEEDGIWFDAEMYSKEEAEEQFIPVEKMTQKNGHWFLYTAYEYDGILYHHYQYMGLFEDDDMPGC